MNTLPKKQQYISSPLAISDERYRCELGIDILQKWLFEITLLFPLKSSLKITDYTDCLSPFTGWAT